MTPDPAPVPRYTTAVRTWQLSELDLFADLSAAEMQAIGDAAPMRQVARGTLVWSPSRPVELLFIVKQGRVRTYRTAADGRSLTTAIVGPGQLFGQMPVMGLRMDDGYAEMLDAGVLCVMSTADVQRLLFTDLRIVARITALLGGRLAELETRLTDTVLKPVAARICSTLATLAGSPPSPVRLTHDQLADLVGTTRETTTKVLGDLKARSYVRLRRGRIDVLDPVALLELASRSV
ncbi:Crp/Fnr family transcriptional regulator [Kineosporia sp. A_224]|uniref:Crp/Fnr family transcriptional regulator n=1 Tax=Kineosporia sp. A_224 TaxID=1962180 RepID=UPI000B4BBAB3|nr:Crp/Fnr family transcriptional regulator [Kineosporia sp. A_224]